MLGIPQFYFDTEILLSNTGDDCHGNIHSNFPGGWSEHGDDVSGFAAGGHTEEARAFQVELHALLTGRSTAVAAHTGSLKPYATVAGSYVYFH